jgi:hypothetical protein
VKLGLILLLIALPCWGQTTTTGKAESAGACSPAVSGNNNTFTIKCGIDKKQGQKMLDILNKILANQIDPDAVMRKLDEIKKDVEQLRKNPPYHYASLDNNARDALAVALSEKRGTISVTTRNPGAEVMDFATTLLIIFHGARWNTQGPNVISAPPDAGDKGIIPIPTGLHIYHTSQQTELALFVQKRLREVGNIDSHVEKDESVHGCDILLFVGAPE